MKRTYSLLCKLLRYDAIMISIFMLSISCHGNSGKSTKTEIVVDNSAKSSDSLYYGKNSLTYTVFGHQWNIKDYLKQGEGKYTGVLFLNEVTNNISDNMVRINVTNEITGEVFNFYVASNGTTPVLHYKPSLSTVTNKKGLCATYLGPHSGNNYYGDSVTVTIKEISATRVSGSFSGKFTDDEDKPSSVDILNGAFDIAFTNEKGNN